MSRKRKMFSEVRQLMPAPIGLELAYDEPEDGGTSRMPVVAMAVADLGYAWNEHEDQEHWTEVRRGVVVAIVLDHDQMIPAEQFADRMGEFMGEWWLDLPGSRRGIESEVGT